MNRLFVPANTSEQNEDVNISRALGLASNSVETLAVQRSNLIMRRHSASPQLAETVFLDPMLNGNDRRSSLNVSRRRTSVDNGVLAEASSSRLNMNATTRAELSRSASFNAGLLANAWSSRRLGVEEAARAIEKPVVPLLPQWSKVAQVKVHGLREDFYATLLAGYTSWVPSFVEPVFSLAGQHIDMQQRLLSEIQRDSVALATNYTIKRWSMQLGLDGLQNGSLNDIQLPYYQKPSNIAQSNLGFLLISYQNGMIVVKDLLYCGRGCVTFLSDAILLFEKTVESKLTGYSARSRFDAAGDDNYITSSVWTNATPSQPRSTTGSNGRTTSSLNKQVVSRCGRNVEGFIGDHNGQVFKFVVVYEGGRFHFQIVATIPREKQHGDAICAMILDIGEKRLCVAGADSMVRIWRHSHDAEEPLDVLVLEAEIPHFSAVRALSSCPIMPSLLLTGGGRHDRKLRIFHVDQEAALCEIPMPAQIVGIVFVSKLEVFVALGHSRLLNYRGLGKVVNVLTGKIVAEIPGEGYALTALKTQGGFCINTSVNDLISFTWNADATVRRLSAADLEAAYSLSLPVPILR